MSKASQSALDPASAAAGLVYDLWLAMAIGAGVVFAGVVALALAGVFARPRAVPATRWIVGGGVALPIVVLSALLVTALLTGEALLRAATPPVARVQVVAKQWWWEVRYLPPEERTASALATLLDALCVTGPRTVAASAPEPTAIVLANELRLPVGAPVLVELATADVIHSLWIPSLAGKVDMIPGRVNRLVLEPDRPGTFRGQCAEFCGGPHGLMALHVVALPEPEFRDWLTGQAAPAVAPADPILVRGQAVFMANGCAGCHAIRGTAARGVLGPDLTHLASRRTIAAGTLDNHVGTIAGWIADPQTVKPGNRMPPTALPGADLRALAAYLASLD